MTNSTRALLARTDAQLRHCPPNLWPCQTIETFVTHFAVLHKFYPILSPTGLPVQFPVILVWASDAGETYAFSTAFSMN